MPLIIVYVKFTKILHTIYKTIQSKNKLDDIMAKKGGTNYEK